MKKQDLDQYLIESDQVPVIPKPEPERRKTTAKNRQERNGPYCKWVGLPLKIKSNGDVLYSAVSVGKHIFRIGDGARIIPNAIGEAPYTAQIVKLWQSANGGETPSQMFVKCMWYQYPEDTHCGRVKKNHKDELFFTDTYDVHTVNTLLEPVEVLSYEDYQKRQNRPRGFFLTL